MQAKRKQFDFARQSETGKEHLKTCKANPKATELAGKITLKLWGEFVSV